LVVAAFVAATMVSIASMLNSASTLVTMDVIRQLRSDLSDSQVVQVGRASTVALLAIAVAWAPQLQFFPSLWQYLQAVLAYAVPPVVAVFLAGMFWRGANARGAACAMLLGSLAGFAFFVVNVVLGRTHIHFLYVAPILTVLDIGILIVFSAPGRSAVAAPAAAVWKFDLGRAVRLRLEETPLWQDYRLQAAILLAITAAVVIAFR
jgi:SSS family solute:Na+ symporter